MTEGLQIGLHAAVIAVESGRPYCLAVAGENKQGQVLDGLPFGPYRPTQHRTLDAGLRGWVEEQTRLRLGYVEQLYTFGDMGRMAAQADEGFVSVGYLALVRMPESASRQAQLNWNDWYSHFPWEDWRNGPPTLLTDYLMPALAEWVSSAPNDNSSASGLERQVRFRLAFGCEMRLTTSPTIIAWDEERVLERYELMYEAGLVDEAVIDGQVQQRGLEPCQRILMPIAFERGVGLVISGNGVLDQRRVQESNRRLHVLGQAVCQMFAPARHQTAQ